MKKPWCSSSPLSPRPVLVEFCHLDTSLEISWKRESQLRKCLHQIGRWSIFLIN